MRWLFSMWAWVSVAICLALPACRVPRVEAQQLQLLRAKPDPYGYPRPAPGETNVPLGTSFFFQVGFDDKSTTDSVLPDSVTVRLAAEGRPAVELLKPGREFAVGYSGKIEPQHRKGPALAVYIDGGDRLEPSTAYTVSVTARSQGGAVLEGERGSWQFTTEELPKTHPLSFRLDLASPAVRWRGGFFTGFCKPSFCTSASNRLPGYELMDRIREWSPKAWSLQRDVYVTSMDHQPSFVASFSKYANVVRELQTRRITAIEKRDDGVLLRVEDFFGHQQYGIVSNRPLGEDYHEGDEVLVADGISHATAKVLAIVEDAGGSTSLLVTAFEEPKAGWKLEYAGPLPEEEDPGAPGLFPSGGCYLRKFRPAGTPCYYWGRVDKEWDIVHGRFGRRLVVNFHDAPGDLAVDGQNWTYPKDYAEYRAVVRAYTDHLIDRYGEAACDFVWSVFNEPDLAVAFWRSGDWNELQKFYDYTVDAILRSFEDHGYDSNRVMVGGLEIGAIFGTHIEGPILGIFLSHCSPTAMRDGALPQNAAVADGRLDGRRSRRVEDLVRDSGGKGSPLDFISVHSYNAAELTAAKLARAKQLALEIDPQYYADLWVSSFECCPDWSPPPDVAAADSYLGGGYFSSWCGDVARRRIALAAEDPRYAFGETILTFWPWPNSDFRGHNNGTQVLAVDEDGDGTSDHQETVALPILNFLGLVNSMEGAFHALPQQTVGGHVVSGFASTGEDAVRILLYSHQALDTQSRSQADFEITLDLAAVPWSDVDVSRYRFDKDHNSYFRLARELRDRPIAAAGSPRADAREVEKLLADLQSGDLDVQIAAVSKVAALGDVPEAIFTVAMKLYEETEHPELRAAIEEAAKRLLKNSEGYSPELVARVRELSMLHVTEASNHKVEAGGGLQLVLTVAANGANFVVIEPAERP